MKFPDFTFEIVQMQKLRFDGNLKSVASNTAVYRLHIGDEVSAWAKQTRALVIKKRKAVTSEKELSVIDSLILRALKMMYSRKKVEFLRVEFLYLVRWLAINLD